MIKATVAWVMLIAIAGWRRRCFRYRRQCKNKSVIVKLNTTVPNAVTEPSSRSTGRRASPAQGRFSFQRKEYTKYNNNNIIMEITESVENKIICLCLMAFWTKLISGLLGAFLVWTHRQELNIFVLFWGTIPGIFKKHRKENMFLEICVYMSVRRK